MRRSLACKMSLHLRRRRSSRYVSFVENGGYVIVRGVGVLELPRLSAILFQQRCDGLILVLDRERARLRSSTVVDRVFFPCSLCLEYVMGV